MSHAKMAQTFPLRKRQNLDKILMTEIQKILHAAEDLSSMRKRMARNSGLSPRTIQKWCDGQNVPSLSSYIHLARCYPQLVDLFLDLCQRELEQSRQLHRRAAAGAPPPASVAAPDGQNLAANVPNDVPNRIDTINCNIRQLWFVNNLLDGAKVVAADIAAYWRVTEKTAKRDITGLRRRGVITYHGSKRTGCYRLTR